MQKLDGNLLVRMENNPQVKRKLLESLTPNLAQWFAQEDSNVHYTEQAEIFPGWVAECTGKDVGLLLLKQHAPDSAEIYWLGVKTEFHRRGIGKALVEAASSKLVESGTKLLFVMTLHPDDLYEPYKRTRQFYESMGFNFALAVPQFLKSNDPLAYYVKILSAV